MAAVDRDPAARGIAIFDLDGTLTYSDTLLRFLALAVRARPQRLAGLAALPGALARYALDRDRGALKGALLRGFLGGTSRSEIAFLAHALLARLQRAGLRPGALAAVAAHRAAGDELVLLSASPDLYVADIGRALCFDQTISTEIRWDDGRLDGRLAGPNRRGEEKRRIVERLLAGRGGGPSAAYGNAASDLAHLALVRRPLLVNGDRAARRAAHRLGIPTADWP